MSHLEKFVAVAGTASILLLELTLDLSFVQQAYAGGGRPSIDPVVIFKLQLVMFLRHPFRNAN